jgi:dephospho-CoA kinase
VESGHEGLGGVVVVDVDPEVAVRRLVEHRGYAEEDARLRISRQASREERLAKADFVVDNSGTPEDLEREVDRCWTWIGMLERPEPGGEVRRLGSRVERGEG